MNKEQIKVITNGEIDASTLTEKEREIALKLLNDLEGTLVIRATSILEFCLRAIQYNRVSMSTLKTLNQLRSECGLKTIENGDIILVHSIKK